MNNLLVFSKEIKTAAKQLLAKTQDPEKTNDDEILIDDKEKQKIGKELQVYSTFIRKFLQQKGNDKILAKMKPLFENPRLKKSRNAILLMLEKEVPEGTSIDVSQIISDLRRILMRYSNLIEKYPAVKLIKEILNFGVVNGVPAFKRILNTNRKLYNIFGTEGTLERKKEKQEPTEE